MYRTVLVTLLMTLLFQMASAQNYREYYSRDGISGKITSQSKIVDYKDRKVNVLRFYNDSGKACRIIGYVKMRYTEISSGKKDYKEKRFTLDLGRGADKMVNC